MIKKITDMKFELPRQSEEPKVNDFGAPKRSCEWFSLMFSPVFPWFSMVFRCFPSSFKGRQRRFGAGALQAHLRVPSRGGASGIPDLVGGQVSEVRAMFGAMLRNSYEVN